MDGDHLKSVDLTNLAKQNELRNESLAENLSLSQSPNRSIIDSLHIPYDEYHA